MARALHPARDRERIAPAQYGHVKREAGSGLRKGEGWGLPFGCPLRRFRSPDGAQRNPGTMDPLHRRPGFRCAPSGLRRKKKKSKEAERRQTRAFRRILRCGARSFGARSFDGVPPRFSPKGVFHPKDSASGQASWDLVCTGVTRLRLSQSREAPPAPVIMPEDMMPKPPGSGLQIRPQAPPSLP